ncbi:MAG: hypothetical protein ACJ789_21215 [Thermomicrobiales bacterium]
MRRVMTLGLMALALLLAVGVSDQVAFATKAPAFKKSPTFTVSELQLSASGTISGLNASTEYPDDTTVFLVAYGSLTVDCFDQFGTLLGDATAPFYGLRGEQLIPDSQIRSNTQFSLTTPAPSLTPEQAGCPAGATSSTAVDVTYWSASVGVIQGGYIIVGRFYYL